MKKVLVLAAAMVAVVMSAKAEVEFAYDAGAEVVSSYIWRGQYNGGLSLQPEALVGFNAADEKVQFRIGAWGNIGASDWKFRKGLPNPDANDMNPNTYFVPEVDLEASLQLWGLTLGATHYYYFGGTPFFSGLEDDGGSQTEVQIGYNFGELTKAGLYFNWYSMVAGNDCYYVTDANTGDEVARRAWSSYFEIGYDYTFESIDLTIGAVVGMTPWKSFYTDYEGGFAVNNIALRIGKTWNVNDVCDIELFGLGSINTYGINKDNCFVSEAGDYKLGGVQKLNGTIGLGFWF